MNKSHHKNYNLHKSRYLIVHNCGFCENNWEVWRAHKTNNRWRLLFQKKAMERNASFLRLMCLLWDPLTFVQNVECVPLFTKYFSQCNSTWELQKQIKHIFSSLENITCLRIAVAQSCFISVNQVYHEGIVQFVCGQQRSKVYWRYVLSNMWKRNECLHFKPLKFLISSNIKTAKPAVMSLIFPSRNESYDFYLVETAHIVFAKKKDLRLRKKIWFVEEISPPIAICGNRTWTQREQNHFISSKNVFESHWFKKWATISTNIFFIQLSTTFKWHDLPNEGIHSYFDFGPDVFIRTAKYLVQ